MARERGSGKTPQRLADLIKIAISEKGLIGLENASGVGKSALSRYAKGIGEPTTATLEKLSVYFGVDVAELRGGSELVKIVFDKEGMKTAFKGASEEISTAYETINQVGIAVIISLLQGATDQQIIDEVRSLEKQYSIKKANISGSVKASNLQEKLGVNPKDVIKKLKQLGFNIQNS